MESLEYNYIKREIFKLTGVDLNGYKGPQMQRRLGAYLFRSNHPNWPSLFQAIRHDPEQLNKLKDYLTINVSTFFRDVEKFQYLQDTIIPDLLRHQANLRVWSAGCSRGQEPYSLAILLAELARTRPYHLLASDLDRSALEWAQAGGPYAEDDVAGVAPAWLSRYFRQQEKGYWVKETLQRSITFCQHNLLAEPFALPPGWPAGAFDLIVCRNVVIYFTSQVRNRLYQHFYQCLRPGGVLFVGGTEIVPRLPDIEFEAIGNSFYQRRKNGRSVAPKLPMGNKA